MESFYEAFINCEHKVLGRRLKPFCLRHCLYLEVIGSPIMRIVNGEEVAISRKDLELAVIICSADRDIIAAMKRPNFGLRFHRFNRGLTAFLGYLTDFLSLPDMWDSSEGERAINAPWILSRATLLLSKTNLTLGRFGICRLASFYGIVQVSRNKRGLGKYSRTKKRK